MNCYRTGLHIRVNVEVYDPSLETPTPRFELKNFRTVH